MTWWYFSVPQPHGAVLHAYVPGIVQSEAIRRLMADDPVWTSREVYCYGGYVVDGRRFRCQPVEKPVFWRT